MADDTPKTQNASAGKEPTHGPVPLHHRLRLGAKDTETNPQGAGTPSKAPTIANGDRKGW